MEAGQSEKGARRFEELWVWQQAREVVKEIYEDFASRVLDQKISAFAIRFRGPEFQL